MSDGVVCPPIKLGEVTIGGIWLDGLKLISSLLLSQ